MWLHLFLPRTYIVTKADLVNESRYNKEPEGFMNLVVSHVSGLSLDSQEINVTHRCPWRVVIFSQDKLNRMWLLRAVPTDQHHRGDGPGAQMGANSVASKGNPSEAEPALQPLHGRWQSTPDSVHETQTRGYFVRPKQECFSKLFTGQIRQFWVLHVKWDAKEAPVSLTPRA